MGHLGVLGELQLGCTHLSSKEHCHALSVTGMLNPSSMFVECAKKVGMKCAASWKSPNGDHGNSRSLCLVPIAHQCPHSSQGHLGGALNLSVAVPVLPSLQKGLTVARCLFASLGLPRMVVRVVDPLASSNSEGNSLENDKSRQFILPVES